MMRPAALLLLVAACSSTPAAPPHARQGRYAAGVTTRRWTDTSRGLPANGTAAAGPSRHFTVDVWYPAPLDTPAIALTDADVEPADKPYPLVVFVHGSTSFRGQSSFLMKALAEEGYVVAAADYPFTYVGSPGGPSDQRSDDQVQDVAFIAAQAFAASADATDPLAGAVDPAGYVASGHSTGGSVSLACGFAPDNHDPKVRAVVALAPDSCFYAPAFFQTRALPLMLVLGTDDRYVPPSNNGERAYGLAQAPATQALLTGGTHIQFTDLSIPDRDDAEPTTAKDDLAKAFARYGDGSACEPIPAPGADPLLSADEQRRLTAAVMKAFLDDALRGEHAAMTALAGGSEAALRITRK